MHIIPCVGARADIAVDDGETPLQVAQRRIADKSDPEAKQCYEKVHQNTPFHALLYYQYLLKDILFVLVFAYQAEHFMQENFATHFNNTWKHYCK